MSNTDVKIGKFALESLTTGMYADPRIIYREYIQNCTDAIDEAIKKGILSKEDAQINIRIDLKKKQIIITDNGIGIDSENAWNYLVGIGDSEKSHTEMRGFRGIGRLGGISYCNKLTFVTSSLGEKVKTEIVWDCAKLRELLQPGKYTDYDLKRAVLEVTTLNQTNEDSEKHYFKVILEEVNEKYSSLLNEGEIRTYLSEVAPVPFNHQRFIYAGQVEDKLSYYGKVHEEYNIYLNDDPNPIFKPYKTWFWVDNKKDHIVGLEFFDGYDKEGNLLFVGWYAKTNWYGQIENRDREIRGLRIRKKNILIGDEKTLDSFFSETRFNKWVIGEIYVYSDLIPNARRDYFEENESYWTFKEVLEPFTRKTLSKFPRIFSEKRKLNKVLNNASDEISEIEEELEKGITSEVKRRDLCNKVHTLKKQVRKALPKEIKKPADLQPYKLKIEQGSSSISSNIQGNGTNTSITSRINSEKAKELLNKINDLENKVINSKNYRTNELSSAYSKDIKKVLRHVFEIIDNHCSCSNSNELINVIIQQLNEKVSGKAKKV